MKKIILFFFINLLVHLPFLNLPPCGTHVWRQCNTLAMSRNFAEEDMNIFEPKIDRRNATNGITGSHFPLYEWLLAACSKVFGFSDLLSRLFSIVVFSFAMFAFFQLLTHFGVIRQLAVIGALLLLSIPELYYHSMNALPDNLALCFALFGLLGWLYYLKQNNTVTVVGAIIFCTLSGLIKFQFLMIPLAAIVFVPFKIKDYSRFLMVWLFIGIIVFSWYYYALEITKINNLKEYGLWIKTISTESKLATIFSNLWMDLPEVLLGWPLLIAFIAVVIKNFQSFKATANFRFIVVWLSMFLVFYGIAIERMHQHAYYFMPVLPLLLFIFILLSQKLKIKTNLLTTLLILNFTWAIVRIVPSRWVASKLQIPVEFSNPELRHEFSVILPPNSKCVVGPDISGCIYFYFTHTKGYSFENFDELVKIKENRMDIDNMRAAGMQYLIINDAKLLEPYMKDLHLKGKLKTIGSFEIWKL